MCSFSTLNRSLVWNTLKLLTSDNIQFHFRKPIVPVSSYSHTSSMKKYIPLLQLSCLSLHPSFRTFLHLYYKGRSLSVCLSRPNCSFVCLSEHIQMLNAPSVFNGLKIWLHVLNLYDCIIVIKTLKGDIIMLLAKIRTIFNVRTNRQIDFNVWTNRQTDSIIRTNRQTDFNVQTNRQTDFNVRTNRTTRRARKWPAKPAYLRVYPKTSSYFC